MNLKAAVLAVGILVVAAGVYLVTSRRFPAGAEGSWVSMPDRAPLAAAGSAAGSRAGLPTAADAVSPVASLPLDSVITPLPASVPVTGIPIAPGESIQAWVDAAPEGTVYIVKTGTHRLQQVRPKNAQQFVGEPGAVLNGARLLTGWTRSGPVWYATEAPIAEPSNSRSRCRTGFPRCDMQHDLYVNNRLVLHVASLAEVSPGRWFYDYPAGRIYVGGNPLRQVVEITHTPAAFTGSALNVTVKALTIEKYANRAQRGAVTAGAGWLVENNVLQRITVAA